MKKIMMTLVAMLTIAATGKAMSYEQARNEALFLTDKMAYELNLTDEQYEAAYEINLDYLMGVTLPKTLKISDTVRKSTESISSFLQSL